MMSWTYLTFICYVFWFFFSWRNWVFSTPVRIKSTWSLWGLRISISILVMWFIFKCCINLAEHLLWTELLKHQVSSAYHQCKNTDTSFLQKSMCRWGYNSQHLEPTFPCLLFIPARLQTIKRHHDIIPQILSKAISLTLMSCCCITSTAH